MADGPPGNAASGKKSFARHCASCHTVNVKGKHGTGPLLGTVWGRKVGTIKGFQFTGGIKAMNKQTWDAEKLDKWLEKPATFVPGTSMAFDGVKNPKEREDIIRFLYESHPKNKKK